MANSTEQDRRTKRGDEQRRGVKLGTFAGITVVLDWSLLIIAVIIATTVAMGPLSQWHSDWSPALRWLVGAGAAVLLFASVLIHEFSHALVARHYGTKVERITLFIFGGMAHMEEDPRHWRAEVMIAAVGPVTSVVLGILFFVLAGFVAEPAAMEQAAPEQVFAALGPLTTLLFWAGNVNIILAIFNLVPAFPLDGGRVLRALLWGATGSHLKATRWAASGGRFFGWLLIAMGIAMVLGIPVPIFGVGLAGGLWLIFIGWFLSRVAMLSYQDAGMKASLAQVPVGEIMRTSFETTTPDTSIHQLVEEAMLPHGQRGFPVIEGQTLVGIISFEDVRRIPRQRWDEVQVREVMTGKDKLLTLTTDDDSFQALSQLSNAGINQMPVLRDDQVVGMLQREDVLRWVQLYRQDQDTGQAVEQQ